MARQLKAKIKIESDTREADRDLKKLGKSVGDTNKSFLSMSKTLGTSVVAGFAAVTVALAGAVKLFNSAITAANFQEEVTVKLATALKSLGSAADGVAESLANQADAIQKTTTFSNEAATQAQATIAAFTQNEDQIKALTLASLDLAEATDQDLNAAALLLAKSFGTSVNALSRYGVEADAAAGSTERLEQITQSIATLWGGQAEAAAGTFGGAVKQLQENLGDTLKVIGQLITGNKEFDGSIRDISKSISDFNTSLAANSDNIVAFFSALNASSQRFFQSQGQLLQQNESVITSLGRLVGAFDKVEKSTAGVAEQTEFLIGVQERSEKLANFNAKAIDGLTEAQNDAAKAAKALAKAEDEVTKALEELGVVVGESVAREVQRLNDLLDEATARFEAGRLSIEAYETAQLNIAAAIAEANGSLESQRDAINGASQQTQNYSAEIVIATGSVDFFASAVDDAGEKTNVYSSQLVMAAGNVDILTAAEIRNATAVEVASQRRIAARQQELAAEQQLRGGLSDPLSESTFGRPQGGTFSVQDVTIFGVNGQVVIAKGDLGQPSR